MAYVVFSFSLEQALTGTALDHQDYPPEPVPNRPQRLAYVEFGDEEAMKAGLDKRAEVSSV